MLEVGARVCVSVRALLYSLEKTNKQPGRKDWWKQKERL